MFNTFGLIRAFRMWLMEPFQPINMAISPDSLSEENLYKSAKFVFKSFFYVEGITHVSSRDNFNAKNPKILNKIPVLHIPSYFNRLANASRGVPHRE